MKRREVLGGAARGAVALGVAKALHNTVAGFGHLGFGENLLTQDLGPLVEEQLTIERVYRTDWEDGELQVVGDSVRYRRGTHERWRAVESDESPARLVGFETDLLDLRAGAVDVAFMDPDTFFERLEGSDSRPLTVELLRGGSYPRASPAAVRQFVGESPTESEALLRGLVRAYARRTKYDTPRYLAGTVDDNLIPVDANLRAPFRPDVTMESLASAEDPVRLFCGEYSILARRAVQAVSAHVQSPPLFGMLVHDRRHKHVYNAFGSVRRVGGALEIPITFVDYMDTTLYRDFRLRRFLGSGFNAYDEWHRADAITW